MKQLLHLRTLLVISLTFLATACVPVWHQRPDISPETLWQARRIQLLQLDRWKIQGRTVITQQREAWNAGIRWQQDHGTYQIKLLGPFAQGGVTLDGDEEQVVLTMEDGQQVTSSSPEALIAETMGLHLPVSALRDWLRGLPYGQKNIEFISYDNQGRLTHLKQQGWDIEFLRYVPFDGHSMPSKIFLKHPDLSLRLVITSWDSVQ
ncbi:MAG: lipoprotein insertase outer membrane protein LolB [Gammaproteobacteria bacterium]|nr:lipoprotein insertase outer membrane protein LolB [Gammaproteobacteria bacterium]